MTERSKSTAKNTKNDPDPQGVGDIGEAEVQEKVDEENAQGFRGYRTDPTPLENYTVKGVTSGAPTPETDERAAARAAMHDVSTAGEPASNDKS